jgi:pilus assembly protein CpaF
VSSELYANTLNYHLGPIADLLEDPTVSEVMINGPDKIFVERRGRLSQEDRSFYGDDELMAACINIAQFSGKRLDDEIPRIDGRLPDGSRVHIVIPPIAPVISVAIRKFKREKLLIEDLIRFRSITPEAARVLDIAIQLKKNILVSGGTGSGKTTLLNVLANYIPEDNRVVVIEDTRELQIRLPHLVQLEARAKDKHGRGEITIRDLLHSTLRLRPDRIIVGEVRGHEALDLLNTLNSGHGGSMTTLHANSPSQALAKLETLVLFAGEDLPIRAIRAQISTSVNVVVQASRFRDGSRKIAQIAEILPQLDEHGEYQVRYLYRFKHHGAEEDGTILGALEPTGLLPTFFEDANDQGFGLTPEDFGIDPDSPGMRRRFPSLGATSDRDEAPSYDAPSGASGASSGAPQTKRQLTPEQKAAILKKRQAARLKQAKLQSQQAAQQAARQRAGARPAPGAPPRKAAQGSPAFGGRSDAPLKLSDAFGEDADDDPTG